MELNYSHDNRIVMTLDAGGTNFVFSAIQGNNVIVDEIRLDANSNDLMKSLSNITKGFTLVKEKLKEPPSAISFAFPGPADYPNGIIGDLGNLPAYRGGVALGPMLSEIFNVPVFINNDGDLFVYGEAIAGLLPEINKQMEARGNTKRYKNLFGITLGTGFGSGIVSDGELYLGDNSMAGEIWLLRNKLYPNENAEELASIRGVKRIYGEVAGISNQDVPSPKEIYEIALGKSEGNKEAAIEAYKQMAQVVGDAIANSITLLDALVVIGGGLSGASSLFMPYVIEEMKSNFTIRQNIKVNRLMADIYNLENENELQRFVKGDNRELKVLGTDKTVTYDPSKKIGLGISRLGTSKAVSIGAYAFALNQLDKLNK